MAALPFVHHYQAASTPESPTLLLLHGTGGNEQDLLPLAPELVPGAGVLSPRGKVLENGMPRFFRRLSEGVFDLEDLRFRTTELANFIGEAASHYRFDASRTVAVGFSNGANIAGSLVLLQPRVLVSNGRADPLVSEAETGRLVGLLKDAGAEVTLAWQDAGHHLVQEDLARAREWLGSEFTKGERR